MRTGQIKNNPIKKKKILSHELCWEKIPNDHTTAHFVLIFEEASNTNWRTFGCGERVKQNLFSSFGRESAPGEKGVEYTHRASKYLPEVSP